MLKRCFVFLLLAASLSFINAQETNDPLDHLLKQRGLMDYELKIQDEPDLKKPYSVVNPQLQPSEISFFDLQPPLFPNETVPMASLPTQISAEKSVKFSASELRLSDSDALADFLNTLPALTDAGFDAPVESTVLAGWQRSISNQDVASHLVISAMGYLGRPYRFGGNNFDTGLDCSGFVHVIYQQSAGIRLPRQAYQQAKTTFAIKRQDLRPGDLVFFNTMRRPHSHVGIYIGENKFIHSPKPGSSIRIEDMNLRYWDTRFDAARRPLKN